MYVYVAILLAGLFAGGIGTWRVEEWRHDALEKDRLEQAAKEIQRKAEHVDTAATGHEDDKARIETVFKTITQEVDHVVEKPVYRNVCLDDDGLRAIRSAVERANARSEPASAVPRPAAAR
jgi:hypothetical protein